MSDELQILVERLQTNVCKVVLGKDDVVRTCLVALLAGEHVLLEDVPGVGKTLVAKALANSVGGDFSRIQFTPDLLPSDIIGSTIFNSNTAEFSYNRGAVFAHIVLADEINRAPPRTQSALLEAMSDQQVSVDGQTYPLPRPFMVIATQNPFEYEGTYRLPESQLDRFLVRVSMGYPNREDERQVLATHRNGEPVDSLEPVLQAAEVVRLQEAVRTVRIDESISDYILDLVGATRACEELQVGVSTRGALSLYRASQAAALMRGRDFVVPDDVKQLAVQVLAHRVIAKGFLHSNERDHVEEVINRLLEETPVPA